MFDVKCQSYIQDEILILINNNTILKYKIMIKIKNFDVMSIVQKSRKMRLQIFMNLRILIIIKWAIKHILKCCE